MSIKGIKLPNLDSKDGFDSETDDLGPMQRERESSIHLMHRLSSKRYRFQTKKVIAELYNIEEGSGNVWSQIPCDGNIEKESGAAMALLPFHTLVQLRKCLVKGALMFDLDLPAHNFTSAFMVIAEEMAKKFKTNENKLRAIFGSLCNTQQQMPDNETPNGNYANPSARPLVPRHNSRVTFETAQIFASAVSELDKARFAMVRLAEPLENTRDIFMPVRFIFVLLGPPLPEMDYKALGCSIAALMSSPSFIQLSYKSIDRQDLVQGLDKFLDEGLFITPIAANLAGQIKAEDIETSLKNRQVHQEQKRTTKLLTPLFLTEGVFDHFKEAPRDPLTRTGRLFGGLVADLRERMPKYASDFKDALTFKTITSILFIFFACFAPAITFGGLMGTYTEDSMGITEALMAQSLCGLIWAFFSAQPLLLLSSTGPVLIFEKAFYEICTSLELDFLTIRVWTGLWIMLITFFVVMFEGSALLRYVTRFTEEIFATLISAIFIMSSLKFLYKTVHSNPIRNLLFYWSSWEDCTNSTNATHSNADLTDYTILWEATRSDSVNFAYLTEDEKHCFAHTQPDTALLTIILLFATFVVAYLLKVLRGSRFLTRTTRQFIGDFGMLISIAFVAGLKWLVFDDVFIKLLHIPVSFGFTSMERRHDLVMISWALPGGKWWGALLAFVPAFLVFILLFVETDITELLLLKKGRGLVKGGGVHWDMMLLGCLTFVCSLLGLPWMCAAAAQSLAHASSLTVMKPTDHGKTPVIERVVEQRVTALVVSALLGGCAFAGRVLRFLPLAILFGVFLYLGVMGLLGMQFIHRMVLFLVPAKHFPDVLYCQKVKPKRIHIFTMIQLICVAIVYAVKSFQTALVFPVVLLLTSVLRHKALPLIFSNEELHALDGHEEHDEGDDIGNEMLSGLIF